MRVLQLSTMLGIFLLLVFGCESTGGGGYSESLFFWNQPTGEELAERHCVGCHQFPNPGLLGRPTWNDAVLPKMGRYLGMRLRSDSADPYLQRQASIQSQQSGGVFPTEPRLSQDEWNRLRQYFLDRAPASPPAPPPHPDIEPGLDRFHVHNTPFQTVPPLTTLVEINDESTPPRLFVGTWKTFTILNGQFEIQTEMKVGSAPSDVRTKEDELFVTTMGNLQPSDDSTGQLLRLASEPDGCDSTVLVDNLQRPVNTAFSDLNGDGHDDIVIAEFGYRTGRLAWFEWQKEGQYKRHTLRAKPGAVQVRIRDFTGNSSPDVLALFGQGDEGFFLYKNQGNGHFEEEQLLQFPPSYGSSYFELADMNGDGALDIVYTTGDNADYEPVMKGYHGVRIFLNTGSHSFEEAYFYPLNGAYKAIAHDFDQDGDQDLAAISFFPDYENSPEESFVFLENTGASDGLSFEPKTVEDPARGRWLVMDSGDLDGDGDEDLVLGSFSVRSMGSSYIPDEQHQRWGKTGSLLVFLENMTDESLPERHDAAE